MNGRQRPVRWWLIALLAYTAATLVWLGRIDANRATLPTLTVEGRGLQSRADSPAQAGTVAAGAGRNNPREAIFGIPFTVDALERTDEYRFALNPGREAVRCSVQVIAECDHHFSYSHLYPDVHLSGGDFVFAAPLTGTKAAVYWSPVAHVGQWTAWERSGVRRLQVKLFARSDLRAPMTLTYQPVQAQDRNGARLAWAEVLAAPVPLGERFELAFDLEGWNGNPFDYGALPVKLEVAPPDAAHRRILPFMHQNFEAVNGLEGERIRPCGPKHFLVRYRPGTTGRHAWRLLGRTEDNRERVLKEGAFDVTSGTPPDFLRVSARSPKYFEHADGRFFYPVGWNIPYPVDRPYGQDYTPYLPDEQSLAFMRRLIDDLADAGGNFARFWMSSWWNGLEWNRNVDNYGGLGRYNLKNAWINDQILGQCEWRGVRLQWETLCHVSLKYDYGWPQHPYHVDHGGFLQEPAQFWRHPRTQALSRNHLSYIIARYADSPAIHSWNVMSEPDILGSSTWPQAKTYVLSQLRFIRQADPYGHITGNQLCMSDRDPGFFLESPVQFVSANAYSGGIGGMPEDQIATIRVFSERYGGHRRPILVAETAGHFAGDPAFKMRRDTLGALWSGVASGLAGTPLSWWWNFNYGENMGQWYRVVADFMKKEDLIREDAAGLGGWQNREVFCSSRNDNLRALMAGHAERRFLFAYNFDTFGRSRGVARPCADGRVMFDGMRPGVYVAEYWNLSAGRTRALRDLRVDANGRAEIQLPEFTDGWAVKIRRHDYVSAWEGVRDARVDPPSQAALPLVAGMERGETAADWSWRILPQATVIFPSAADRAVLEARIAVPAVCRGRTPRVTDESGRPVAFDWQLLEAGAGWRIVVRAARTGTLTVTAGDGDAPPPAPPDEESWGLQVTVAEHAGPHLYLADQFERQFARLTGKQHARMSVIDQVENPVGESSSFLAVYSGPLLAPVDGEYGFASNSDDGSFVKIDGEVVVSWPGGHNIEVHDRPAENTWEHRGTVTLRRGLHQVDYYHQQNNGACMARLGWLLPNDAQGKRSVIAEPFSDRGASGFGVVPEWALDGRLPCAVEICFKGQVQAVLAPSLGLALRRPSVEISVAAVDDGKGLRYEFFYGEGARSIRAQGQDVPFWSWNVARRGFSIEWDAGTDTNGKPYFRTLAYDMNVPLAVGIGTNDFGVQVHAPRRWVTWPVGTQIPQMPLLTIRLETVALLGAFFMGWPDAPCRTDKLERRMFAPLERLVEISPARTDVPMDGARLARWWNGAPPEKITAEWLQLDPWNANPEELAAHLGQRPGGTGVLVRLGRRAFLLGLSDAQIRRSLQAVLCAILESGAVPVLILNPECDVSQPSVQSMALAFHRLSVELGCPFIDMRTFAP